MDSPSTTHAHPSGPEAHLAQAIGRATETGAHRSDEVCAAVEDVVDEVKRAEHPPERMLVLLKSLAHRVLAARRASIEATRELIAWIVRCAVKAYYRP